MFRTRQYFYELGGALLLYALLLVAAAMIERTWQPQGVARILVGMSPMLGVLAAAAAILRGLWRMDEMQRRIQFDALALAFLGTALITFGWGFAEDLGAPALRAFAVWPLMGILWAFGIAVATWRYR